MTRREFCGGAMSLATTAGCEWVRGGSAALPWQCGHFQFHQIYTGTGEAHFVLFPDGTSMLLDCGDGNPHTFLKDRFGDKSLPIICGDGSEMRAGEYIARYVESANPNGRNVDYFLLSHFHCDHLKGFAQAAETLHFRRAIDRGWPNYDTPLPIPKDKNWMGGALTIMQDAYRHLFARDGLKIEMFRVGAQDQVVLLHNQAAFSDFSAFNLCGNGKIAMKDGTIVDCYANEHAQHQECVYNENAMSLGMIFTYGKFRLYTAGDFTASDGRKGLFEGKKLDIEKILAQACGGVDVAKANHHAGWSCPNELVASLHPRVWLAPVWWQLQCDVDTMNRLSNRDNYSGNRLILPGVMCAERRTKDAGRAYLADVPEAVHTPSHIVVDVPPGGASYQVACVDPISGGIKAQWSFLSANHRCDKERVPAFINSEP